MNEETTRRILVVGCSRSGTTLLQSLLVKHPRIHTFPETGVFLKAFGMRGAGPWVFMGLSIGKERKALSRLLVSQKNAQGPLPDVPPRRYSLSRSVLDVGDFFDRLAVAHGKDIWLAKTPRHVFHAERIVRSLPGCACIHIIRRGEDVVASIVDRAKKFPDQFGNQSDPSYAIRQWNRSMRSTMRAIGKPGHAVVVFEELVNAVEVTMKHLCNFLALNYEEGMSTPADPSAFTNKAEQWKSQQQDSVRQAASKFEEMFDDAARNRISNSLDTGLYESLRERALSQTASGFLSAP